MATVVNVGVSKSASGRIVTFLRTFSGAQTGWEPRLSPGIMSHMGTWDILGNDSSENCLTFPCLLDMVSIHGGRGFHSGLHLSRNCISESIRME